MFVNDSRTYALKLFKTRGHIRKYTISHIKQVCPQKLCNYTQDKGMIIQKFKHITKKLNLYKNPDDTKNKVVKPKNKENTTLPESVFI